MFLNNQLHFNIIYNSQKHYGTPDTILPQLNNQSEIKMFKLNDKRKLTVACRSIRFDVVIISECIKYAKLASE